MILKAIKKPIPVEFIQFTGGEDNEEKISNWSNGRVWIEDRTACIDTREGTMTAGIGSYIVKGPFNEIWAVQKEIFEATYERVEE